MFRPNFITEKSWQIVGDWNLNFEDNGYEQVFESKFAQDLLANQPPIEKNRGMTILTIPGGLSLEILKKIAAAHQMNLALTGCTQEEISRKSERAYTVILTNSVIEGSRSMTKEEQSEKITGYGGQLQGELETAALIVMTFILSGERLFDSGPCTYNRLAEDKRIAGNFDGNVVEVTSDDVGEKLIGAAVMFRV